MGFALQKHPKNLDPSYMMDLDFWDCFEMEIPPYNRMKYGGFSLRRTTIIIVSQLESPKRITGILLSADSVEWDCYIR